MIIFKKKYARKANKFKLKYDVMPIEVTDGEVKYTFASLDKIMTLTNTIDGFNEHYELKKESNLLPEDLFHV